MDHLIEFKEVCFTYGTGTENPVQALKGINLQVKEGEFTAVIGRNGSGKSTPVSYTHLFRRFLRRR